MDLFHEAAAIGDIAKREHLSAKSLLAYWRNLQRQGRLPCVRPFEDIEAFEPESQPQPEPEPYRHSAAGPPPNYDVDGRPSVKLDHDDDLLLEELFEVHHAPPGSAEYTPALDLPAEHYRESAHNRQQRQLQKHK